MKKENSKEDWQSFLRLCLELKTPSELNDFFNLFLTIEERNDIADRFSIIRDLLNGQKTQREMSEELHVSIAKITRGSNSLKIK